MRQQIELTICSSCVRGPQDLSLPWKSTSFTSVFCRMIISRHHVRTHWSLLSQLKSIFLLVFLPGTSLRLGSSSQQSDGSSYCHWKNCSWLERIQVGKYLNILIIGYLKTGPPKVSLPHVIRKIPLISPWTVRVSHFRLLSKCIWQ